MQPLGQTLSLLWTVPFAVLLLSIALIPLKFHHWWESNLNKAILSFLIALPVAIFLVSVDYHYLVHSATEYASFIILLAALFIISGGIVLEGDIRATPLINTTFLAVGAVLANFIGTTGASMLLIRPVLRTNAERNHVGHIPVFFIFLVANLGGLLTPLGDPPLFLGFLRGVPFLWTLKLWPMWAMGVGIVLAIFYVFERFAIAKESAMALAYDKAHVVPLKVRGTYNFLFLLGVVLAVGLSGLLEKAGIHPTPWREIVMLLMTVLSYKLTPRELHEKNRFSFGPIVEVAVLFAGIFVTMVPALLILQARGAETGIAEPWQYFWLTGTLSSFLDNAPTYLTYFSLALGVTPGLQAASPSLDIVMAQGQPISELILEAISVGAVFMGANSYIGNGPNFMVKSIAEKAGIRMPSFFGYMLYSAMILVPIYVLITFVFFVR